MIIKASDRNLIIFVVSLATFGILVVLVPQFINENQKKIIQGQEAINQTTQQQLLEQRETLLRVFDLVHNTTDDTNKVVHEIYNILNKTK